ncbi:MAG: hydantoinase B/oxoprolinase family protein, partial [Planctomycetota bacterium]
MSVQPVKGATDTARAAAWQFWLDVGGTFTDCLGRTPDGKVVRHKVLSTGVTMGQVTAVPTDLTTPLAFPDRHRLYDSRRQQDPADFWVGCRLRLFVGAQRTPIERIVTHFDVRTGCLAWQDSLAEPLPVGTDYELLWPEEAPLLAIRWLLGKPASQPLPPIDVRLGTTKGTNALLTRRGARTAFITTQGFADILAIGYQNRPRLFELNIEKPTPLYEAVVEIDERVMSSGVVRRAPDLAYVRAQLAELKSLGMESLAICLLHADRWPTHEKLVADVARELGFDEVSVSHEVAPLIKIVPRGDTTVVDAYLTPVLRRYLARLEHSLESTAGRSELRLLTSAGGLVSAARFHGKDSVLSGPAGGVVGFSRVARVAGFDRAIGFDMGGTSTDVSRFDGRLELEYETEKAGVRLVTPLLSIETVAAGGGSLCQFDGVKLTVGPDSAGAYPGPACYGRGGPLAVTDLNLWLGRIVPEQFPFPLSRWAVKQRLTELADQVRVATGVHYELDDLAAGLARIANSNMARAIRTISVARGYDPRDYPLVAFGGAAPQHACAVARELDMQRILIHSDSSVLSAYGIGLADVVRHRVAGVQVPYDQQVVQKLEPRWRELVQDAQAEVLAEGVAIEGLEVRLSLDMRYHGVDAALTITKPADDDFASAFAAEHRRRYGYVQERRSLEITALRVEVVGQSTTRLPISEPVPDYTPAASQHTLVWFAGGPQSTALYQRDSLRAGARIQGPALIVEPRSVIVVEPDWTARSWTGGLMVLERVALPVSPPSLNESSGTTHLQPDPTLLELFNNQFAAIAEQMGITLRQTSSSVNVKERLDFSCALFTATGDLVVNAPHIPVHLGAMSATVKAILAANSQIVPGDVFVTNDPYAGGSHLPDVTVITPVHDRKSGELRFFTASRAHHAEIGGQTPGSMPPFSRILSEEGVLIRNFKLVDAGASRFDELRTVLATGEYPSRNPDENLADLAAQVAANQQGRRNLEELVERQGWPLVSSYMQHIQTAAERAMRATLALLPSGTRQFRDYLDDGSPIQVAVTITGDSATIDFTGTGPVLTTNLNANSAITQAAVLYVLRCLIGRDVPLNQGLLAPIRLVLPTCLLNPQAGPTAATSPAVVGGNVETSQRVVDVLLGAFGLAAASQGTMNNLLFGDSTFGYYETICGGAGATATAPGASAVHTHMTNTRLTDPEVFEQRFPVLLREFSIRRGSGGSGQQRGGDGVIRRIEFLRPLTVSLLHVARD